MKMADSDKAEDFVDAESPTECLDEAQSTTGSAQDEHLKTETTTSTSSPPREKEADSPLNTEGSDKPASLHIDESDSSNPCMMSPSSSGHLADSDTLSSGEEGATPSTGKDEEGNMDTTNDGQATGKQSSSSATGGRKARRLRSESEMPQNALSAKKNRCQPTVVAAGGPEKQTNGKLAKVKGHRSQKHKERMRLLRQKREAAARKKYNLLQDSRGSKTIKTDLTAGFRRASERSRVGAQIHGLLDTSSWDRNGIGSVLEEAMTRFAVMQRQTEERFRVWMEKLSHLDSDNDSSKRSSDAVEGQQQRPVFRDYGRLHVGAREQQPHLHPHKQQQHILPEAVTQNGNLAVPDPGILNV
ncbi:putative protein C18orf25 like [Dissostichus eleginoides]|uniref:E3 ubiquitin-protein ligase Arkadia N-terminal domain-containing protein n=1 Tax=Dissostichus eleginoides TaxID=100907 RepID=A0AAD9BGV3_DISEL|nr:putative protein C18orf25 like [Dissostichus eleginoides]